MLSLRVPLLSAAAAVAVMAGGHAFAQARGAMPSTSMPSTGMAGQGLPTQTAPDTTSNQGPNASTSQSGAATDRAPAANTGTAANTNATTSSSAQLTTGLTVKDRTGAAIGQIADISTDPKTGQQLATIQMGSESFRLPTDKLGVFNGAANVNLTQADIEAQLHPGKGKSPQ
jgi:hypothetical protein